MGPVGALWVNAIRMTVGPRVFARLSVGVAGGASTAGTRRIGGRAVALFAVFTAGSTLFALLAAPRPIAKQQLDLMGRGGIDLTALRGRLGPLPARARMFERADCLYVMDSH